MPIATLIAAQAAPNQSLGLLMMLAVFAIFYFLLIMPVQRRQKKVKQMLQELKPGDRVVTTGGVRGVILSLKDDSFLLRVPPDQVKLEFARSAVAQRINDDSTQ